VGIGPVNSLLARVRVVRDEQSPISVGSVPVIL
jgi:hypothetical protein